MNWRALAHAIETGLSLVAAGTVTVAGLSTTMTTDVVAFCAIAVVVISTYLASTTSGTTSTALATERAAQPPVP